MTKSGKHPTGCIFGDAGEGYMNRICLNCYYYDKEIMRCWHTNTKLLADKAACDVFTTINPLPNAKTAKVIRKARAGKGLIKCKNSEDLFKDLRI